MPYAEKISGLYRISNLLEMTSYIGQSKNLNKRIKEHFRLLRKNIHPNYPLQDSFNRCGEEAFQSYIEVSCDDPDELDILEEAFLTGDACFDDAPAIFNVSNTARRPMWNRRHTEHTKRQISNSKLGRVDHVTSAYRQKLSDGQLRRFMSDPKFVAKIRFIVDNPNMSYAERGRVLGADTSSVRKLALRYNHLKGKI